MTWKCRGERAEALSFQIMRHIITAGYSMYLSMYSSTDTGGCTHVTSSLAEEALRVQLSLCCKRLGSSSGLDSVKVPVLSHRIKYKITLI